MTPYNMTESDIRAEIARLEQVLDGGNATPAQAARLEDLRRHLSTITRAKENRSPRTW